MHVVESAGGILGDLAIRANERKGAASHKEDAGTDGLHKHVVTDGAREQRTVPGVLVQRVRGKLAFAGAGYNDLGQRIAPVAPVEQAEGYATPPEVIGASAISFNLNVHDHGIGLLDFARSEEHT